MADDKQMTKWETAQDGLDKLIKSHCPKPSPHKGEVLVKVHMVSLNYRLGLPLDGVLQTYRVFPIEGLVKAPDYLTDEEACTLPIAAVTAWMSLNGSRPLDNPGGERETVLLQGTGGVSISGLQIAHAAGANSE